MASISTVVSEIANSLHEPNNSVLRENIKAIIIHTRNEIIRHSYEQHRYVDKGLTQRFKVSLISVTDGDIQLPPEIDSTKLDRIKRTTQKVPKPVRLTNNLPFDRVSSVGFRTNREFPFIKETTARFRQDVPGLCGMPCYDYINGYIYIFPVNGRNFNLEHIIIEGAFEVSTHYYNHFINIRRQLFFKRFFRIISSQMRVLRPLPSINGCATFISTYLSAISSKVFSGILSMEASACSRYWARQKVNPPFEIVLVRICPAKS